MAYATYTTEAIVCGSKDSFTSDRSFLLFTERAGMLWASARSVRTENSKQRYALQDFSIIRVSLVKGKGGWRIGSVEATGNPFLQAETRRERAVVQQIIRQLRRFLQGEEPVPMLYADVRTALATVAQVDEQIETLLQLRLLHQLGYIRKDASYEQLLEGDLWVAAEKEIPRSAGRAIDLALRASHL